MHNKNPYESFEKYLLRTPLLSFNFFKSLTSNLKVSNNDFNELCSSPTIREAIFIASPSLLEVINKWLNGELHDEKKIEKLKLSVFKYITRMSSRSTPFGIFAGCSLGTISDETKISLTNSLRNKNSRLDMGYLIRFSKNLVKNEKVKNKLFFFANNSIYKVGDCYRYLEYLYINTERQYRIAEVGYSEYLERVILTSKKGVLIEELILDLVDDDISFNEASGYINELIDNQILISELEPSISGENYLNQLRFALKKVTEIDDIKSTLEIINKKIIALNKKSNFEIEEHLSIEKNIRSLDTDYSFKHLFQTDLMIDLKENYLSKEIIAKVKKSITLLNIITNPSKNTRLTNFKDSFYNRFENREIPLTIALDVELGIGYGENKNFENINPLLDDISFSFASNSENVSKVNWSNVYSIFQNKLNQAYRNNDAVIYIKQEDFDGSNIRWNNLPDTLSCLIQLTEINDTTKIKIKSVGGSSAANFLTRFGYYDDELHKYIKDILSTEDQINPNKIIAEVLHLPGDRVANVLMHPDFREFEIPLMTKSNKSKEKQIQLDDLMISVRNNKLMLKSKKHNKEIIPRVTNAHNFHTNVLPIYQFLADMQTQNKKGFLNFYLGDILSKNEFIPRIEFDNVILQSATWNLQYYNIKNLLDNFNNDDYLINGIKNLRDKYKIPQYVYLVEGEDELLINLSNITSIQMFLKITGKKNHFTITEFLFEDATPVRDKEDYFTNEIVLGFYNKEKSKKNNVN